MSAVDPTFSIINALHAQNQERLKDLETDQKTQLVLLTRIDERTSCLPEMQERIASLEATRNKQRGAKWTISVLFTAVGAGLDYLLHRFFH